MSQAFRCDSCGSLFGENFKKLMLGEEMVVSLQFGKRIEGPPPAPDNPLAAMFGDYRPEWENIDICPACCLLVLYKLLVLVQARAVADGKEGVLE